MRGPGGLWQGGHCGHPVPCTPHPLGVLKCWGVPSSLLPLEGRWAAVGSGGPGRGGWGHPFMLPEVDRRSEQPCPGTGGATDWACRRRHPCHRPGLQPGPTCAGRAGHGQGGRSALRGGRAGVRGLQQVSWLGLVGRAHLVGTGVGFPAQGCPCPHPLSLVLVTVPPCWGSCRARTCNFLAWAAGERSFLGLDPSRCPEPTSASAS